MKLFGKKENIEVRGVRASNDKRNAVTLFIIEAVVVLLFIAGVLLVLNYVGVISLSNINSAIFSGFPVNREEDVIEVVSDIPGYSIKLENKKELVELLESWGIYGKEYGVTYGATGNTNGEPLKKIVIHLVDEEQGTNAFGTGQTKESIYSSSLTTISPGRFDINIYIEEKTLNREVENFNPEIIMRSTLLSSLYKIVNPYKNQAESASVSESFNEQFSSNPLMQMDYFKIEKK